MNPIAEQLIAKLNTCGNPYCSDCADWNRLAVREVFDGLRDLLGDGVLRFGDDGEPEICDLRRVGVHTEPGSTGVSAVIDPEGRVLGTQVQVYREPQHTESFVVVPRAHRETCPECGGRGARGCGAAWHEGKPDNAPSPADEALARRAHQETGE